MTKKLAEWASEQGQITKISHRMPAEGKPFRRWCNLGMIATNLKVIWEMSVKTNEYVLTMTDDVNTIYKLTLFVLKRVGNFKVLRFLDDLYHVVGLPFGFVSYLIHRHFGRRIFH